jgi:hypothetical protein
MNHKITNSSHQPQSISYFIITRNTSSRDEDKRTAPNQAGRTLLIAHTAGGDGAWGEQQDQWRGQHQNQTNHTEEQHSELKEKGDYVNLGRNF